MKIFTSYFYQIRFFKPYMIPLSTAVWDPKWYYNFKKQGHVYVDRNGVINGLRIQPLMPGSSCDGLCRGLEVCEIKEPTQCEFLKKYYEQLTAIDFNQFMYNLSTHIEKLCKMQWIENEPFAVFIVHEAPNKACSERCMIQKWFTDNGVAIQELNPKEYS